MLKKIFCIIIILFLTGCTATYDLDISPDGFKENLTIQATNSNENESIVDYPYTARYDVQGNDEDPTEKYSDVEYYNSTQKLDNNDLKVVTYDYLFSQNLIEKSNIIISSFDTFILKKYNYDEDNKYMIISANDFSRFENNAQLEKVTINITSHYEVISSNADEVDKNVYTWYLTKDDLKSINLVYNPNKVVDYRTFWEKLMDGEYTNIFTISILLAGIGLIIYFVLKRKGDRMNK